MSHVWTVSNMEYILSQNGKTNVVLTVHWSCSKAEGEHSVYSCGTIDLATPGETFIEWANITEEIAIGWAKSALGEEEVADIQSSLDSQLAEKISPTHGSGVSWEFSAS